MGAWGYGILQNDTAQNGLVDVAYRIKESICSLSDQGSEQHTATLGAATGLLLQFSPYSFDPENDFLSVLMEKLRINQEYFPCLPGNGALVLTAILEGQGEELACRPGELAEADRDIERALHSDEDEGFIMQKAFSVCEHALFQHPIAAAYLQSLVDEMVQEVDDGFADEEMVYDLSREGEFIGSFGLLLLLPHCRVDPDMFRRWRERFHQVLKDVEPSEDEREKVFEEKYNAYLELAFRCGIEKYSK